MKICVQGLWHLGSVISACLAEKGYEVTGYDENVKFVASLNNAKSPVYEPHLNKLIKKSINKNLYYTNDPTEILKECEILWLTYDSKPNSMNSSFLDDLKHKILKSAEYLNNKCIIIISSQLPVGSVSYISKFIENKLGKRFEFIYIPENLRLGNSVNYFLKPDRIIVGLENNKLRKKLIRFLSPFTNNLLFISTKSSEMVKHAINGFLANSIVFANEIANISEKVGANANQVSLGLKSDIRIGNKAYLNPGMSFSGETLERDLKYLKSIAYNKKLKIFNINSIIKSNNNHKKWVENTIQKNFGKIKNISVAYWGLAYKSNTDTLRDSLNLKICKSLIRSNVKLKIYDHYIDLEYSKFTKKYFFKSAANTLNNIQVLILGNKDENYYKLFKKNFNYYKKKKFLILDPNLCLLKLSKKIGPNYITVGNLNIEKL